MTLKRTPLAAAHERRSARMVEFAGYAMPVQYRSIIEEHRAVREAAGLFDVSHMGQIHLEGPGALEAGDHLLTRPTSNLQPGRVRYALLCNESGGVVDDVTAYRLDTEALMLCVNAANVEKDRAWIEAEAPERVTVRDASEQTGLLALQGPASSEILMKLGVGDVAALRRFRFTRVEIAAHSVLLSRTGYTGADGFELYCDTSAAEPLFEALLAAGEPLGLIPAGLGARDTLRIEAALPLYGHELDDRTSPLEAGLARFVALDGGEFIGADALRQQRAEGLQRTLVGFALEGRGVARSGHGVAHGGESIGEVTSGAPSPTLGRAIGLAYVPPALAAPGTSLDIEIRGRAAPARVVETPFVEGEIAGARRR